MQKSSRQRWDGVVASIREMNQPQIKTAPAPIHIQSHRTIIQITFNKTLCLRHSQEIKS